MKEIGSIVAWYPRFELGHIPQAVECRLSIVEALDGKRYLKTPFALLNAYADDDCERQIGRWYYASQEECTAYLDAQYPAWKRAQPIMEALAMSIHHHGAICGPGRIADKIGCSVDDVYKIARGTKGFRVNPFLKTLQGESR